MYILFYLSVIMYPNKLRDSSTFLYPLIYSLIHGLSIFLFLSAGINPGFVDETETPESRREKAKLFVNGQYDEFRDVKDVESQRDTVDGSDKYESVEMQTSVEIEGKKEAVVKAIEYIAKIELPKKRFCEYCSLEQPYRAKHCRECERCVRKYDHHCFWIGGCVGELNHRKFYLFLLFQTISFC
jgi:hypothetical protein